MMANSQKAKRLLIDKVVPRSRAMLRRHQLEEKRSSPRKEMGDGRKLRAITCCIVVKLEQRYCQKLHIFGDSEHL